MKNVKYLRAKDTADYLAISKATLYRWVQLYPDFPKQIKLGNRTVVWSVDDLAEFIKNRKELSE